MQEKRYEVGDGRSLTVREIANEIGAPYETVRTRVARGYRGSRLLERYKCWNLGYSENDLDVVTEYAMKHIVSWTSQKFQIPHGAINCLLRGERWRVK